MKNFEAKSGLFFRGINFKNPTDTEQYLGKHFINEINSWKNPKIDKFIVDTKVYGPIGDFLKDSSKLEDRELYVVFDNQEIIATSLLIPNSPLIGAKDLGTYIAKTLYNSQPFNDRYLNLGEALNIKANTQKNNLEIAYLIVNPNRLNEGYGTQTVNDICANVEIIGNGPQNCALTQINKLNKPCIHVFENNGFASVPSDGEFNYYYKLLSEETPVLEMEK